MDSQTENLDLSYLKFNQLKTIAQANSLDVAGTAKQPYIDALTSFSDDGNTIIVPEGILDDPAPKMVMATGQLPAGTFRYQQKRMLDESTWKDERIVHLTEAQAATLNDQTKHSNLMYEKVT